MPKKNEYTISLKHDGPVAKETSDSIAEQVQAFLESGGQINQIPSGVSGRVSLGEKAKRAKEEQQRKDAQKLAVARSQEGSFSPSRRPGHSAVRTEETEDSS